jgi:signal transduction histidine kinase
MLSARTHMQLTRVLRESVSNVIHHSGARRCQVTVALKATELLLSVEDDGTGLASALSARPVTQGQGLANIERRARKLGGRHGFETGGMGGLKVWVQIPLRAMTEVGG